MQGARIKIYKIYKEDATAANRVVGILKSEEKLLGLILINFAQITLDCKI